MFADSETILSSFPTFMQRVALPMHLANPGHRRLDGNETKGNWDVAGRFRWKGRIWKVHMDSHFESLLLAYYAYQHVLQEDAFVEADMQNGVRLDLAPTVVTPRRTEDRYLYIYRDEG